MAVLPNRLGITSEPEFALKIDDSAMFMKGIDVSYAYEGYEAFKAEGLQHE